MVTQTFQLPLPIHQLDDSALENFYAENNLPLLNSLKANFRQLNQPFFFLWGTSGCGKTHLLKACCQQFLTEQRPAIYLPLKKSQHFSSEVLDNLEQQQIVCLDDLQEVIGRAEWEMAIFDLINRIKETNQTLLLISADQPLANLAINLPDLLSRLAWGEVYQINPLNETQKALVLQQKAKQRGIALPDDTANFLLKRLERDTASLFETLDKLDQASLQAQRKLTIPFVKEILQL